MLIEENHLISADDRLTHLELNVWKRLGTSLHGKGSRDSEAPLKGTIVAWRSWEIAGESLSFSRIRLQSFGVSEEHGGSSARSD